jgi:hypothetical protein
MFLVPGCSGDVMTRYILVDVDGVLNPNLPSEGAFSVLAKPGGVSYNLILNKRQADLLLRLAEDTNSELVWATTWENQANEWIGPEIGLPQLPVVKMVQRKFSENLGSIKARSALAYAGDSKFVYFDDEYNIGYCLEGTNGRHVYVDPKYGLVLRHIVEAEAYLKN